jgi:imidazolonepropionase-like amidohydrolase
MARQMAEQGNEALEGDLRLVEALFRRLRDGGVTIGAGSDVPAAPGMVPGWGIHQELEALVLMGVTPVEALRAATHEASGILGQGDLGHLDAGARADFVVVRGDPTQEITDTRQVEAVWLGGRAVDLEEAWTMVAERFEAAMEMESSR